MNDSARNPDGTPYISSGHGEGTPKTDDGAEGGRCPFCQEHRIVQRESTDLGYDFTVFACYSQYHIYPDRMDLVRQGDLCKDRRLYFLELEIAALKERLEAWREFGKIVGPGNYSSAIEKRLKDLGEIE